MSSNIKHYEKLDIIRVISFIAVLLYHLNILKGGYLAVCTFFVMTGYLSTISLFKKDKVSLKEYYLNKIIHLYIPLLLVVFITITVISFIPSINWLNLKPETTSVLLGYNNFWQLSANLDYFTRHINSPFIHLWYIAILLQFDLVFPFVFIIFKKIGNKLKIVPSILLSILVIISTIYFYLSSINSNIMAIYYNTFTRIFSILFGVLLGFIHNYYNSLVPIKNKVIQTVIFYLYLIILVSLFIMIDAKSIYFPLSMIISTVISCRLINYSIINSKDNLNIFDKLVNSLSKISYEIYLVQYPVIFLFQELNFNSYILMLLIIFTISYLIHFSLDFKDKKYKILKYILLIILLIPTLFGTYKYVIAKDHTLEMKELEEQLNQNEEMMKKKQEEYAKKMKEEYDSWNDKLKNIEEDENKLADVVKNLPVVGVGDSVMLGAVSNLYKTFPNGYFDAKASRTAWVLNDILKDLNSRNLLGNPIVLNLGANGDCTLECKQKIMKTIGNRKVFWVNATNDKDVHVNSGINNLANLYANLYVIDWASISKGHNEYFIVDGIHLTEIGREAYVRTIYDSIYENYLNEYKEQRNKILKEKEDSYKQTISFYGNDMLLNAFSLLKEEFPVSKYITNNDFNYESLKEEIINSKNSDTLPYKIVFIFDKSINITDEEMNNIIKLCDNHEIYIVSNKKYDKAGTIDFYKEIEDNSEYLMADKIHLSESGNKALVNLLVKTLKD